MTFYERYEKCCHDAGILPSSQATADQLGCARSNISTFAKSGITPKGDIVAGAAKMLNISADYLLGIIEAPRAIDDSLSKEEMEVISILRELNEEGCETAINVIRGLACQDIYKKYNKDKLDKKEEA
ncbi:MAG: hypothetical protein IJJ64_05460 [Butyrivibrio sp.]|nr:hypothetical protein [Butyrivibrio sp.]